MNEAKHTPGPWIIRDRTGTVGNPSMQIEGPQGEVVARVIYQDGFGTLQANTSLIATAPELLGACRLIVEMAKRISTLSEVDSEIYADVRGILEHVISKAEGSAQ